jgi:hypothetical protein
MEDLKETLDPSTAAILNEKKPWHAPEVRIQSVPGITASGHQATGFNDGTGCS